MIIAVDFDGTIVTHKYPKLGEPVPHAIETLLWLQSQGVKLILYTMRSGFLLEEAVEYCKSLGVIFYGINENPSQKTWTTSKKIFANKYIDDAAVGCPLIQPTNLLERPYVDWLEIREIFNVSN